MLRRGLRGESRLTILKHGGAENAESISSRRRGARRGDYEIEDEDEDDFKGKPGSRT